MNQHYKYWERCQRCPKHICENRHSENVLISSIPFINRYDWHIEAPCNYMSLNVCHDKYAVLAFHLRVYRLPSWDPVTVKSVHDAFDYLLTDAKNLEEAISITKIRKQLGA